MEAAYDTFKEYIGRRASQYMRHGFEAGGVYLYASSAGDFDALQLCMLLEDKLPADYRDKKIKVHLAGVGEVTLEWPSAIDIWVYLTRVVWEDDTLREVYAEHLRQQARERVPASVRKPGAAVKAHAYDP